MQLCLGSCSEMASLVSVALVGVGMRGGKRQGPHPFSSFLLRKPLLTAGVHVG